MPPLADRAGILERARRRAATRGTDQRGIALVLTVMLLVVMLGMSALVFDLGYARSQRRQVQTAADAAALAGAQELPAPTAAETEAKELALANLPGGSFDWSTCSDTPLARSSSTQCISFNASYTRIRVRTPVQTWSTGFARIFGDRSTSTRTVAEARVVNPTESGLLPFNMFSGFGSGEACLDSGGGGGAVEPCTGPTSGNFGFLDFHLYGNEDLGTTASCTNGGQNTRLDDNIAMGADHDYTKHPTGTGNGADDDCTTPGPNKIAQGTGNGSAFDTGMRSGASFTDGEPARLQRGPFAKVNVSGSQLDNKPLWEFIPTSTTTGIPTSCRRTTFDNRLSGAVPAGITRQVYLHRALSQCFFEYSCGKIDLYAGNIVGRPAASWNSCTGARAGGAVSPCGGVPCTAPLFTANTTTEAPIDLYDIQRSPRFVYVPQVWASDITCPGGSGAYCYYVKQFRAVFLQRLVGNNVNQMDFEPSGGAWTGNYSGQSKAITAFVFRASMLPGDLGDTPNALGQNRYVSLTR
jgi:Flp pilus assembly protein TadG